MSFKCASRKVVLENLRYSICFDTLSSEDGTHVNDYLVVLPKVRHPREVAGICVLPEHEKRIGLMRCYRHHFDDYIWQAPMGFVQEGEDTQHSASRELVEETGLQCDQSQMKPLGFAIPDAGLVQARVALFAALECHQTHLAPLEQEPGMGNLHFFDVNALESLLQEGDNLSAATAIACFRYLRELC